MRALTGTAWVSLVAVAAVAAQQARADVNARLALTSAYLQRGLVQSRSAVSWQGAVEYRQRGWFAGVWASAASFGGYDERDAEIDYYGGYGRRLNPAVALEASAIHYTYRGASPRADDWNELQLSAYLADRWTVTWGIAHNWWSTAQTTQSLETTYRYPLPARLTLDATVGYQFTRRAAGVRYGYAEAGIARRLDDVVFRLGYAAVDADAADRFPGFADNRWVASVTWQP